MDAKDFDEKTVGLAADTGSGTGPPSVKEEASVPLAVAYAPQSALARWCSKLDSIPGLEVRGIERVREDQRHPVVTVGSYVQMFIVWFAINCTANNMTLGILGPYLFRLGFKDAIL